MPKSNTQDETEILTASQLAAEWRVSRRTIVRYVSDGKLPATKLPSGHIRISRADADAALTRLNDREGSGSNGAVV